MLFEFALFYLLLKAIPTLLKGFSGYGGNLYLAGFPRTPPL